MNNEYDNEHFFEEYAKMSRSINGLEASGEWHQLKELFPDFKDKTVLDLDCGYGWHAKYAVTKGASHVLAIDASHKMIEEANKRNKDTKIIYQICHIQDYDYPSNTYDIVISNLALHYIKDLDPVFQHVYQTLKPNGSFVFNIEHPVFTADVNQDWIYSEDNKPLYWPIDNYYIPGTRQTNFLGCPVQKEHHTLTQIVMGLLNCHFKLEALIEAAPPNHMLGIPGMKDELRRPMMLLIKIKKGAVTVKN